MQMEQVSPGRARRSVALTKSSLSRRSAAGDAGAAPSAARWPVSAWCFSSAASLQKATPQEQNLGSAPGSGDSPPQSPKEYEKELFDDAVPKEHAYPVVVASD